MLSYSMKIVAIDIGSDRAHPAMEEAIRISDWCKEQGLQFQKDYDWHQMSERHQIHVRFYDHCEEMSTLFGLRWIK